ncbi:MAG: hypothetical protein RLZZ249_1085 [Actinomycetota bacterium]|jgi:hypothetical protein
MRRLSAALVAGLLTTSGSVAWAEDEQWPLPNEVERGHHSIVIEDSIDFGQLFSSLTTFDEKASHQLSCSSLDDINCSGSSWIRYNVNFANCETVDQFDCVEQLSIKTASGSAVAKFVRYAYENHPNAFIGDGKVLSEDIGQPSVWSIPEAPHRAGDLYLLVAGHQGFIRSGQLVEPKLHLQLIPVSELKGIWDGVIDENGFGVIAQCVEEQLETGQTKVRGCGGGAQDFGRFRCAIWEQDGTCLLKKSHREADRISITLRLGSEPTGWLHGRIQDPLVSTDVAGGLTRLTVDAKPVRVPTLYHGGQYAQLAPELQSYWDECMTKGGCNTSTRITNSEPEKQPGANRNLQSYQNPFGPQALKAVTTFAKHVNETPVAAPTAWGFRTLDLAQNSSLGPCVSKNEGTLGVVTTNATAYSEGPPELRSGSLRYSVAGLHFGTDGKTLSLGTYDLIMRSDFARCIYGFSKAPIQAAISVLSVAGESVVATTEVSERNGWLKLAAYGFTYSEKEVRVTLSQDPEPRQVSFNLSKFATKSSKLSTAQMSSIRQALVDTEANAKATCTALYVKASDKSLALTRAKNACAYVKKVSPALKVTSVAKVTKSKSLDGRVTVSSN